MGIQDDVFDLEAYLFESKEKDHPDWVKESFSRIVKRLWVYEANLEPYQRLFSIEMEKERIMKQLKEMSSIHE